jgi:hypothetical protein
VGTGDIDGGQVDFVDDDLLLFDAGLRNDLPGGVGNEALAPELDAVATDRCLETNAVGDRDVAAVRDGVRALDGLP